MPVSRGATPGRTPVASEIHVTRGPFRAGTRSSRSWPDPIECRGKSRLFGIVPNTPQPRVRTTEESPFRFPYYRESPSPPLPLTPLLEGAGGEGRTNQGDLVPRSYNPELPWMPPQRVPSFCPWRSPWSYPVPV